MTVGHRTSSSTPLRNLQSWMEPWAVASNLTINKDASPGHTLFSTFSAVCWLFGRKVSTELSATGEVPVGLISNNWGGTKVEVWVPSEAYGKCNRTGPSGAAMSTLLPTISRAFPPSRLPSMCRVVCPANYTRMLVGC